MPARATQDALTLARAKARKQRVGDVHYTLEYAFDVDAESVEGTSTIRFQPPGRDIEALVHSDLRRPRLPRI